MLRTGLVHEMREAGELATRRGVEEVIFHQILWEKAAPKVVDEKAEETASRCFGWGNKVRRKERWAES